MKEKKRTQLCCKCSTSRQWTFPNEQRQKQKGKESKDPASGLHLTFLDQSYQLRNKKQPKNPYLSTSLTKSEICTEKRGSPFSVNQTKQVSFGDFHGPPTAARVPERQLRQDFSRGRGREQNSNWVYLMAADSAGQRTSGLRAESSERRATQCALCAGSFARPGQLRPSHRSGMGEETREHFERRRARKWSRHLTLLRRQPPAAARVSPPPAGPG